MTTLVLVLELHGNSGTRTELEAIKRDLATLLRDRWQTPYLSARIEEREAPQFPGGQS